MAPYKNIKRLIWLYLVLLIFEGALRKWVFPGAADALLIIRDPVVILIYALALGKGVFPTNAFVAATGAFIVASVLASFAAHQHNLIVMCYGLRINYLHLPLIWIMAKVLDREDVERFGTFILLVAIPMALVMVKQFRSPMDAPINRGVGGSDIGQIFGADGHIRPPGFFAFITGPQLFCPLAGAYFFYQASTRRRLPWIILVATGVAIAVSLPVSISRTVVLATALVGAVGLGTLPFTNKRGGNIIRIVLMLGVVMIGLSFLPVFKDSRDAFLMRWQTAAESSDGDAWQSISDRLFGGILKPLQTMTHTKLFGSGIGVGSNVGARLLSGNVGFLLAEDEWDKIILELGPVLGGSFILFRIILTAYLGWLALQALLRQREALPLLIFSATGVAVLQNQWGPPTLLGFAVFGAGLVLAAIRRPVEEPPAPAAVESENPADFLPHLPPTTRHRPAALPKFTPV